MNRDRQFGPQAATCGPPTGSTSTTFCRGPGDDLLEFDLVSEQVAWFVNAGSSAARVPLHVA